MKKLTVFLFISAFAFTFVNRSVSMENSGMMEVEGTPNKSDHSKSDDTPPQKERTKSSKKNNEKPKISTNQLLQENNAWLQALYQQNAITVQYQLNMQQAQDNKCTKSDITELREKTQSALTNLSKKTDTKIKEIHENKTS